jgi:hypothetical protein
MRANRSRLREQHIHPTTTLQKEDGEERSTKTTFVSDVARSGWSTFLIDKDDYEPRKVILSSHGKGNTWNRNAQVTEFHPKC